MWIVRVALNRPYTFIVLALLILILSPVVILRTPTDTLVDFGARRDEISSAQARLLAANLDFNNEHLILIQQVSSAYYNLLNATGLREAAEVNVHDAQAIEDAASERKANGLATLPDVLEARAATAKADYDLQSALGAEQTTGIELFVDGGLAQI